MLGEETTHITETQTASSPVPLPLREILWGVSHTLKAPEPDFNPCQGTLELPSAEVTLHFCPGQLPTCMRLSGAISRLSLHRVLPVPKL